MPDWLDEFTNEGLNEDNLEDFNTSMAKYETKDAAIMGGFAAQKMTGTPFRMPESMESLPDDASRDDFKSKANALLGVKHATSVEDLIEMNMKAGSPNDTPIDDALAGSFKQWVVDKKIPVDHAQSMLEFYNDANGKATAGAATKAETDKLDLAKATNEALIKHFGSEAKVTEMSELLKRAVRNNVGLSNEEAEEFADALADSMLTKNPVMARVMLNVLSPLAAENRNLSDGGPGPGKPSIPDDPLEGSPAYIAAGWSPPEAAAAYNERQKAKP